MNNLVELKKEDLREVEGGWIIEVIGVAGGIAGGLFAIGFVAGVTYALAEKAYEYVTTETETTDKK